jgi:phage FluMu protein gp41
MLGLRTGKNTRYEVAARILQPKSVVDTEVTGLHFTVTNGYIADANVVTWLAGARPAATVGTKYSNIAAFSAVAANRP